MRFEYATIFGFRIGVDKITYESIKSHTIKRARLESVFYLLSFSIKISKKVTMSNEDKSVSSERSS